LREAYRIAEVKNFIGHRHLCVCESVPRRMPTLLHGPRCNLGNGRGCPLVVHYWADLQSVHGFRCYDNIHACKLIALFAANAYSAKYQGVLVLTLGLVTFVLTIALVFLY